MNIIHVSIFTVIACIFTAACGQNKVSDKQQDDATPIVITDNDFSRYPFSPPLEIDNVEDQLGNPVSVKKVPIVNPHDSNLIDTIYTFRNKRSTIEMYRSANGFF